MQLKCSAHGAYHHPSHVGWSPTSRQKVLQGACQPYLEKGVCEIARCHPAMAIETVRSQVDPLPLVIVRPPTYAVSAMVGKSKAKTRRAMRKRFPWSKKVDWRNACWSVGCFSSTVGVNADVIQR
jgi:REP element-mobilizing transposase RayT